MTDAFLAAAVVVPFLFFCGLVVVCMIADLGWRWALGIWFGVASWCTAGFILIVRSL